MKDCPDWRIISLEVQLLNPDAVTRIQDRCSRVNTIELEEAVIPCHEGAILVRGPLQDNSRVRNRAAGAIEHRSQ